MVERGSADRPQPRPYHHGDLRSALLVAAAELLERDGPESISLRAVARAAGVSQTAPYNHFSDKQALLAALAADGLRTLADSQVGASEGTPPGPERIVALGRDYVEFALAHPQTYRLMFGVGVTDRSPHPEVAEAKDASFAPIRRALADQSRAGALSVEPERAAITAWALVHGLSMLLLDGSLGAGADRREYREWLVDGALATLASAFNGAI